MPELFGLNLPAWIIILYLVLTNPQSAKILDKILSIFGISLSKEKESELEEERWRRNQSDKMFDVLKSLIEGYQQESRDRDKILSTLTMSLNRNTDTVARQTDMIRLLAYNASTVDEKLGELKEHISTRRLNYEKKS